MTADIVATAYEEKPATLARVMGTLEVVSKKL